MPTINLTQCNIDAEINDFRKANTLKPLELRDSKLSISNATLVLRLQSRKNTWQIHSTATLSNGKRSAKRQSFGTYPEINLNDARRIASELSSLSTPIATSLLNFPLEELLPIYLEAKGSLAKTTIRSYSDYIKFHIPNSPVDGKPIHSITAKDMQDLYQYWLSTGLNSSTSNLQLRIVKVLYNFSYKMEGLPSPFLLPKQ